MKIICRDGHEREFTSLFDLYVQKGFDPAFLIKDDGLLSMSFPPGTSSSKIFKLASLGITVDPYFWHYSWLHRKINPTSIEVAKVMDGYKWIAISPSFKWESQNQILGVKLDLFTLLVRMAFKLSNFLLFRNDKKKMYESLIYPAKGTEFEWSTGYEYIGVSYDFDAKEKLIYLGDTFDGQDKTLYLHPSILGWSTRVFVAK